MKIGEVTDKQWEDLIDCYIKNQVILESRVIYMTPGSLQVAIPIPEQEKWKGYEGPKQVEIFPTSEYFGFRIEGKKKSNGTVSNVLGTLIRYTPNDMTNCGEFIMRWDSELFSWLIPCENGTWYQTIPGNVLSMNANVLDIVNNNLHPLFEFDRLDAPKEPNRKWILKSNMMNRTK
jgi:hypothetical protein